MTLLAARRRSTSQVGRRFRDAAAVVLGTLAVVGGLALTWFLLAPDPWWVFGLATGRSLEEDVDATLDDFVQHAGCYAVWTTLLVASAWFARRWRALPVLAVFVFVHAVVCESLQAVVPLRTADLWDGLANVTGVMVVSAAAVPLFLATGSDVPDPDHTT